MIRAHLLVLATMALVSCGSGDTVGLHIEFSSDGPAEITTRSLMSQTGAGPVEGLSAGVDWSQRARMVCSRGQVADLGELRLGGITFNESDGRLRVTVPCGPDAAWIDLFVPRPEESEAALRSFDPKGDQPGLGDRVVLEVAVPGRIVSSGALPTLGTRFDHDSGRATLEIAVGSARTDAREIIWDITWR